MAMPQRDSNTFMISFEGTLKQMNNYAFAARKVLTECGAATDSPAALVEGWDSFVKECEAGYSWDISEYDNEIRVRRDLERLLKAESLQEFPAIEELSTTVARIDERFRCLLQADVERPKRHYWFDRGILKQAGTEYAKFFLSAYGVHVEEGAL